MKYKRLIYVQISIDAEVHLSMVRVLSRNQEVDISDISEVSL